MSYVVDEAVHVSFCDRIGLGLKYAKLEKGRWNAEVVESGKVGPQSSIVVGDSVRIAYFDCGNEDLKYAVRAGGLEHRHAQ